MHGKLRKEVGCRFALDPPDVIESKLAAVAQQMQESLSVRDRFWHLKTHKSCFNGTFPHQDDYRPSEHMPAMQVA